jgi:hypothetical protein
MYVWDVCMGCMYGMYVWDVCMGCMYGMYVWDVCMYVCMYVWMDGWMGWEAYGAGQSEGDRVEQAIGLYAV